MISQNDVLFRLRGQPFEPFCLRLTDGTIHTVRHPGQALVTERSVVVGIPKSETAPRGQYQDYALVSLLHVVQIDPIGRLPGDPAQSSELPVTG